MRLLSKYILWFQKLSSLKKLLIVSTVLLIITPLAIVAYKTLFGCHEFCYSDLPPSSGKFEESRVYKILFNHPDLDKTTVENLVKNYALGKTHIKNSNTEINWIAARLSSEITIPSWSLIWFDKSDITPSCIRMDFYTVPKEMYSNCLDVSSLRWGAGEKNGILFPLSGSNYFPLGIENISSKESTKIVEDIETTSKPLITDLDLATFPPMREKTFYLVQAIKGNFSSGIGGPGTEYVPGDGDFDFAWIAMKRNDKWEMVWQGAQPPPCNIMDNYAVPADIYSNCFQLNIYRKGSENQSYSAIKSAIKTLNSKIDELFPRLGSYPPDISGQLKTIREEWDRAEILGKLLLLDVSKKDEAYVEWKVGELYRLGHNMDEPNAFQNSERYLLVAIEDDPSLIGARLSLGSLYVNTSVALSPKAEKVFLEALPLAKGDDLLKVYDGLFFAEYYQGKMSDAKLYVDKALAIVPNDKTFLNLKNILVSGGYYK